MAKRATFRVVLSSESRTATSLWTCMSSPLPTVLDCPPSPRCLLSAAEPDDPAAGSENVGDDGMSDATAVVGGRPVTGRMTFQLRGMTSRRSAPARGRTSARSTTARIRSRLPSRDRSSQSSAVRRRSQGTALAVSSSSRSRAASRSIAQLVQALAHGLDVVEPARTLGRPRRARARCVQALRERPRCRCRRSRSPPLRRGSSSRPRRRPARRRRR